MLDVILHNLLGIIASILSGVVLWKIKDSGERADKRYEERLQMEVSERNMLLGVADLTILIGRKLNDNESVNGELEESIIYLKEKKNEVRELTNREYFKNRDK